MIIDVIVLTSVLVTGLTSSLEDDFSQPGVDEVIHH
jgi:hypothetical protein